MTDKTLEEQFLDSSFESRDIGETTIREYLKTLLRAIWTEGESFSGKRPFGNSGWEFDLTDALAKFTKGYGKVHFTIEDGEVIEEYVNSTSAQRKNASKFILDVIDLL